MVATAVDSTDIQAARREFLDGFNAEAKALSDGKVSWAYSLRYRLISDVADAAAQHTIKSGGSAWDFGSAADDGTSVVNSLSHGLIDARECEHDMRLRSGILSSGTFGGTAMPHLR